VHCRDDQKPVPILERVFVPIPYVAGPFSEGNGGKRYKMQKIAGLRTISLSMISGMMLPGIPVGDKKGPRSKRTRPFSVVVRRLSD
jgi:hypothetical protein